MHLNSPTTTPSDNVKKQCYIIHILTFRFFFKQGCPEIIFYAFSCRFWHVSRAASVCVQTGDIHASRGVWAEGKQVKPASCSPLLQKVMQCTDLPITNSLKGRFAYIAWIIRSHKPPRPWCLTEKQAEQSIEMVSPNFSPEFQNTHLVLRRAIACSSSLRCTREGTVL